MSSSQPGASRDAPYDIYLDTHRRLISSQLAPASAKPKRSARVRDLLRRPRDCERPQVRRPDADPVAPRILRGIERLVRARMQIVQDVLIVHAIRYEPDAHRNRELRHPLKAMQAHRLAHARCEPE